MPEELNKITYILGAGASAQALPIVSKSATNFGYNDSLRKLAQKLDIDPIIDSSYHLLRDTISTDLKWLADKGDEFGTIDTYASYCAIKDQDSLKRVKDTISFYFTVEQFIENKLDNRYRSFLPKILNNGIFPNNVKVLSWNYDFQMQIAAEEYDKETFHYGNGVFSHHGSPISYYPALGHEFNINAQSDHIAFSLVHLNGIAGFYFYEQTQHVLNYFINDGLQNINQLFEKFQQDRKNKHSLLTFAFEKYYGVKDKIRNALPYAKKLIENTDYLVVIGYSFPTDNVETDNAIFEVLKAGSLKGIYFQDPINDSKFIRNIFKVNNDVFIENVTNVQNFFIPREIKLKKA